MIRWRRPAAALATACGSALLAAACATVGPRQAPGVSAAAPEASRGPSREACAKEFPAVEARLAQLYRERLRIREKLASSGFERTSAEAIAEGSAAPGLTLDAARSADALEQVLKGRALAYPGLTSEIDWIAANWFDPVLMRWTSAQIRSLAAMTAQGFRDLKSDTMALRALLPDLAASRRRREELGSCARREPSALSAQPPARPASTIVVDRMAREATTSPMTCGQETARVRCQESVTVEALDVAAAFRPLDSASMTGEELSVLGPDSAAWIAFVRHAAGATVGVERVYVDGLPALANVPSSMIGRITVNGDPFSAEYSAVGETRVNIDLNTPDRRWRANMSSPSFGPGGGSPLGPTGKPVSRSTSLGVSGPVPRLPLTFTAQASRRLDARRPLFVVPESGMLESADAGLQTRSSSSTLAFSASVATSRVTATATFLGSRLDTDHAGIGGTNGPTTGQRLDSRDRAFQASWRVAGRDLTQRGGISFRRGSLDAMADSPAPATVITGQQTSGGDELASSDRRSESWAIKHVVESRSATWMAGAEAGTEWVSDHGEPNPMGRLQFTSPGDATATWIVSRGRSAAAARTTSAVIFGERLAVNTPRVTLRSGFRIDWHSHGGVIVSPRVVASARVSGFQVSGGAGLFAQAWSPDLFVIAAQRDGTRGETFVVRDIVPERIGSIDPADGESLRLMLGPGFERRKELIVRAGLQRRVGSVQTGIDHTWTRGQSLPGASRERDAIGLVDRISSDRARRRHQTHVRASARRGMQALTAYYQHAWSFDDSDGPFVSPARAGDVRGEWARSAGVPRHTLGASGSFQLPYQIRTALTVEARSATPYNILTGLDAEGMATFNDRGGRPRNNGSLPAFWKVSLSASRTVRIPQVPWLAFDLGVRADNLTNRRNVTSVGRVIDSPSCGQPIDASAGRSIRVWASLAR